MRRRIVSGYVDEDKPSSGRIRNYRMATDVGKQLLAYLYEPYTKFAFKYDAPQDPPISYLNATKKHPLEDYVIIIDSRLNDDYGNYELLTRIGAYYRPLPGEEGPVMYFIDFLEALLKANPDLDSIMWLVNVRKDEYAEYLRSVGKKWKNRLDFETIYANRLRQLTYEGNWLNDV